MSKKNQTDGDTEANLQLKPTKLRPVHLNEAT